MKILKKIAILVLLVFLFLLILFIGLYFYDKYFAKGQLLSSLSKYTSSNQVVSKEQNDAFSIYASKSYVMDPDLGTVPGTVEKNEAANEFHQWNHKYWVTKEVTLESLDELYDRFIVMEVTDEGLSAIGLKNNESKTLTLKCSPENTALFKSFNMQFVSANFDITGELKPNDELYTKCVSESCEEVGPKCVIVRSDR